MARYIDADKLIAKYDRVHNGPAGGARKLMVEAPTEDVVEAKYGHWIRKDYKPCGHDYLCSVCGFGVPLEYKHCPECGAKMDGKKKILNITDHSVAVNKMVQNQWISVEDRLPEEDTRVFVYLVSERSYTEIDTDRMACGKWVRWGSDVTHWMPLPEPPKGE